MRRKGSAAERHFLFKPWVAGIIPAQQGEAGFSLQIALLRNHYTISPKPVETGFLPWCFLPWNFLKTSRISIDKMLRPFYFWKPFYCNSGVLLLNLKMIRETGLFERLRRRVRTKKMNFPDQTAIAFLCKTKKELPRRFNEQRKIRKNTVIKHFVGFFQWYGPVFVQRVVKPTEVERVHKVMKIHEFDDVYEKYNRLAAEYGFAAL